MKKYLSILILSLAVSLISSPLWAIDVLRINCTIHSPTEILFIQILEEVAQRKHFKIQRQTPPVGRSLINVNSGIDDGDGPRIAGLETTYPNLLSVPEPFGFFEFSAFSKNQNIRLDGWESLVPYNAAYIHGWKIFDLNITKAKSIVKVKDMHQLFSLLNNNRTDIALITRLAGLAMIKEMNLQGIYELKPPLEIKPMYLYLHKKHSLLISPIISALKEIKKDGTYQKIYDRVLKPLAEKQ